MIVKTHYATRPDGVELYQRTSDKGVKLRQTETGFLYDDPIDIEPCPYTYEETSDPIDSEAGDLTVADALEVFNEFGVDTDDN